MAHLRRRRQNPMNTYNDADEVQLKVRVPAKLRWQAKSQAALGQLNMGQFVQAAIEEKIAREATAATTP
jgi:hypothetical protein